MEGCIPISYHPMVLLPWLSSMSSHGGHSVHCLMVPMGWYQSSAKCMWFCRHPLPLQITWSLHPSSVDAAADIHMRWCSLPLIHPREVLLAWCWVITRPLSSHGVVFLSLPPGVVLTGWGWYICPILGRHPHTRECQFLMWWGRVSCSVGCMTACVGPSLHMKGHLLWSDDPPHEACPPTCL